MKNEAALTLELLNGEMELYITNIDDEPSLSQKVQFVCEDEGYMLYNVIIRRKNGKIITLPFDFEELSGLEDTLKLIAAFWFPYRTVLLTIREPDGTDDLSVAYCVVPSKNGGQCRVLEYTGVSV